ncbi:ZIP family metal transporter [Candidatus Saccharibacteria bacterium]|nr:ZIP family metal transporter [Candidatus Saccharibacteria bacterium]
MPIVLQVFLWSLAGGLISLIGGIILLASKKHASLAEYATAFAAGALLAAALLDMLPEALENNDAKLVATFMLAGIIIFFLLELFLGWFHRHRHHDNKSFVDPVVPMIILGDVIHNFIDGIAIAAGFLISPATGVIVTLAVAAHEIPREIGSFGLLLHKKIDRKKVLIINLLSTFATVLAAITFFVVGDNLDISFSPLLGLVTGFFIYIAASDIIPSIHSGKSQKTKIIKTLIMFLGIAIVYFAILGLDQFTH